nr:hypothetical protein [Tanacetum cinerariifolium]
MMKGSDIGIQEKKAKLFNEWERNQNGLISVQGNGNQNQIGNGNLVVVRAEGNTAGFFIIAVQTPTSGISILLAVGTPSTGSGNLYCQWKLSPSSGNAFVHFIPNSILSTQSRFPRCLRKQL